MIAPSTPCRTAGPLAHPGALLALALSVLACNESSGRLDGPFGTESAASTSLAQSAARVRTGGSIVAYSVDEDAEGGVDRNGDGDTSDEILVVVDTATNSILLTVFAVDEFVVAPPFVVFTVYEADHGSDLDGDGDLGDRILHTLDVGSGVVTNLGLQVPLEGGGSILPQVHLDVIGTTVAVLARDDDFLPYTLRFRELLTGNTVDTGLTVSPFRVASRTGDYVALVSEIVVAMDLNGDGDLGDDVVHVIDPVTGGITNLELATGSLFGIPSFTLGEELLVIGANEALNGNTDFDMNGVIASSVVHVHELATGATTNTGIATRAISTLLPQGRNVVFSDLDGFLVNWDGTSGTALETELRAQNTLTFDSGALFTLLETNVDLDGNGALGDQVLHALDFETGLFVNLGVAAVPTLAAGGVAVAWAFEAHAGQDLNGDGDAADEVLYRWDPETFSLELLGGQGFPIATLDGEWVLASRLEDDQDLNGDGDTGDRVAQLSALDGSKRVLNLGLAVFISIDGPRQFEGVLPLLVHEGAQGKSDLNGDGDMLDRVLFLVEL